MKRKTSIKKTSRYQKKRWINEKANTLSLAWRNPQTMPDRIKVTLNYADVLDSATGLTSTLDLLYRANSLFQPGLGTHQPNGYDQFTAFYSYYRVLACKIDVSMINNASPPGMFSIIPSADSTLFTSPIDAIEAVRAKHTKWLATASRTSERLSLYHTTREILGMNNKELYDDTTAAITSANPARLWWYHVVWHDNAGSANVTAVIKLKFYCEFFRRVALGPS